MTSVKKIAVSIFTNLFLFFTITAHAENSSDALSQLLKSMHSMQANFVQTIKDKNGKSVQQSSGRMLLQRPNQFRWEVTKPNQQIIVTNGKRLWIYDPDLEQVTIRSLTKAAGETPAMLLSDENLALGDEFSVKPINRPSSSLQWFYLVPKDKSSMVASLQLGFNNQTLREMHLEDHLGHMTVITFSDIKLNAGLSAALFNFKPPAHIDVIDETKRH